MKKFAAIILALVMALALVACGGGSNTPSEGGNTPAQGEEQTKGADLSKYPAKLSDWTAQQFNDYFTEEGVYTDESFAYIQDHATYYTGYPIDECGGYMDDDGLYFTGVWTMKKDDSEGSVADFLAYVKEHHTFDETMNNIPVDHMADGVMFLYSFSQDEDFYNAFDAAYNKLITELAVTPDF